MLDIFEIVKEEGGLETMREMVVEVLIERFNVAAIRLSEQIRKIQNTDILKGLLRQAFRCKDIQEFEASLNQVI